MSSFVSEKQKKIIYFDVLQSEVPQFVLQKYNVISFT